MVPYISERLRLETNFYNEANNAEHMAKLIASEPRLRDRVYIPKVYRELSTERVMVAEWIEGVQLWDKETLTAPWKGGKNLGSPGCDGTPLDLSSAVTINTVSDNLEKGPNLKPERTWWRGADGQGGLGVHLSDVMQTMVDLFSAQIFLWGDVHCDPHPGNIFVRRRPGKGTAELVLLDHGLYIHLDPPFRRQYALFWKSLLTFDEKTLRKICESWGVTNLDVFASATLMRPYASRRQDGEFARALQGVLEGKDKQERAFIIQQQMRKGLRAILGDEHKWPRELLFLGRNLRIVQVNNQFLGSPVNRIKITGTWASRALVDDPDLSLGERWRNWWRHLTFRLIILSSDVMFYTSRVRQILGLGAGMENDIEETMRGIAKHTFGIELNHELFDA